MNRKPIDNNELGSEFPVVRIATGQPREIEEDTANPWRTGFFKLPISQKRTLSKQGMEGDGQADLVNHGGPDKALLCYSADHYPYWEGVFAESGLDPISPIEPFEFGLGGFGENLTVSGLTEENVCLGDTFQWGSALIQVSQPRQPCWKLGRRWGLKLLPSLAVKSGRMGWYTRVLEEGEIEPGDCLVLRNRELPDWSIGRLNHLYYVDRKNLADAREMAENWLLAESWREDFRKRCG